MTGAYQFLKKYGVAVGFGTGAILSVLSYLIIVLGYPEFTPSNEELYQLGIFDFALYTTYFLIFAAILLVVVFSGMYAAKNPKESVKGLIGLGIIVVVFILTYLMGDGTLTSELITSDPSLLPTGAGEVVFKEGETQSSSLQMADGLIKFGYVAMVLAIAAMFFAAGRDLIKS